MEAPVMVGDVVLAMEDTDIAMDMEEPLQLEASLSGESKEPFEQVNKNPFYSI